MDNEFYDAHLLDEAEEFEFIGGEDSFLDSYWESMYE